MPHVFNHGRGIATQHPVFARPPRSPSGRGFVTGMDGEFLWLNNEMQPLTPVSTPHPMRVRQATITDGHLIATWLDRELLLACMGAMPVGTAEEGKQRSELRTSIGSQTIHYPAGNTWAHALDAEPMALATDGTTVVFDLYRRGVYGIGINADEHWRMPPPTWSYPKRRPRNEETVALNMLGEECWSLHVVVVSNVVPSRMGNCWRSIFSPKLRLLSNITSSTATRLDLLNGGDRHLAPWNGPGEAGTPEWTGSIRRLRCSSTWLAYCRMARRDRHHPRERTATTHQ